MSLRIEQDGRLCRIALAAPDKRNVLDEKSCRDLLHEMSDAAADSGTGAILLEGDGPIFCAGTESDDQDLFTIGRRINKPVIAAVQGVALSGGLALVANAHVVVAAQGTSFGLTDIREGKWHESAFRAVAFALGDRRATVTKDFMSAIGIPQDRFVAISYGKERPQCTESNEACWQKNRRVHFLAGEPQRQISQAAGQAGEEGSQ